MDALLLEPYDYKTKQQLLLTTGVETWTIIKPNSVDQKYMCYPYCTLCLMSESHLNIFGRIALKQFMRLLFSCGYVTLPSGTGKVSHINTVFGPYLLCRALVTLPDPCRL